MKDSFSDTFFERACKRLPTWLQTAFSEVALSRPYELSIVQTKRRLWAHDKEATYRKGVLPDGTHALIPFIPYAIVYGDLDDRGRNRFMQKINNARDLIPNFLKVILAESGIKIKAARILSDINHDYKTMKMRGQIGVMDNTHGCFEYGDDSVCVTQGQLSQENNEFELIDGQEVFATTMHEFGHALEYIVFPLYRKTADRQEERHYRDFVRAYREDVANLNGRTKTAAGVSLEYYLEEKRGGTQETEEGAISETFAELLCVKYSVETKDFQNAFPKSTEVFERILMSLRQLIEVSPNVGVIATPPIEYLGAAP